MIPEDYQEMCAKCRNRKACKTPCAFVEAILQDGNKTPFFESANVGADDQPITVIKSKNWRHEINETNLEQYGKELGGNDGPERTPFNTDAESPFANFKPTLNQTTVFIYRFFLGKSYEDIAAELETTIDTTVSHYRNAKNRLLEALNFADDRNATAERYETLLKRNDKAFGKLPKGQHWYLMNRVLGLTVPEIADLDGVKAHRVNAAIKAVADKLKTGNLVWLECSDDDRAAAHARLEKKRQRDRKHYNSRRKAS